MKILIILLIFLPISLSAQAWHELYPYTTFFNFEDSDNMPYLAIDSNFNSNGNWQIGAPQKSIFNSAVSSPYVIVTDSINSYQANDTSSFVITIPLQSYATDYFLTGNYYVDSDSLKDFGKIEYSHDNGATWILVSDDTTTFVKNNGDTISFPNHYSNVSLPILTGSSSGWKYFSIDLLDAYNIYGMGNGPDVDTALYRFSFISDSIVENRDGLMFDDLQIVNVYAFGLNESISSALNVYPNPNSTHKLNIQNGNIVKVEVYSIEGKLMQVEEREQIKTFSIESLPLGQYVLKLYDTERIYAQKFIRN